MRKVLAHGTAQLSIAACPGCGCSFEFSLETDAASDGKGLSWVVCPDCGQILFLSGLNGPRAVSVTPEAFSDVKVTAAEVKAAMREFDLPRGAARDMARACRGMGRPLA